MYSPDFKDTVLIYFTANWCGACKRVNWDFLFEEFPDLKIYKCDVDQNTYTPGFCGVRSIPNFLMVGPAKKLIGPMQSSDTGKIAAWIKASLLQLGSKS
jgi:thioredoxin-like negative regulator of GroEL